jgi:ectoine hydroxylase-related dioxygenase (phytanoyl-CoA dioxygenase family)
MVSKVKEEAQEVFVNQLLDKKIIKGKKVKEAEFEDAIVELFNKHFEVFANCGKQVQHLISLHRLTLADKLLAKLKDLGIASPVISTRPVLYFNKARLAKTEEFYKVPPHQDWRSMQGSLNSMVVWIPLIDVTKDLGALMILPESHKLGLLESRENAWFRQINSIESKEFVSVEVKAGDALFFSAFLVHSSGSNILDKIRWSCHFRYNDLEESTFIKRGYAHPYIYKPIQELITPDFPSMDQIKNAFQ